MLYTLVFHISSMQCWCDSMIVLHWLNDDGKKQEVFFRRSIEEVHKLVNVDCWYHVEWQLSPADILYRSLRFSKHFDKDLWFKGPSTIFLDDIPYNHFSLKNWVLMNTSIDSKNDLKRNLVDLKFMNIAKYCTYSKMLRVTAYVLQ